jgi:hypothetical protein
MTTYTQLKADVIAWSSKTDIEAVIPSMCRLFEARVNRELRVRQMEAAFAGAIASNALALPVGFLQFKRLWPDAYPGSPLKPQTLDFVAQGVDGTPEHYAIDGATVRFDGTGSVSVTGVFYQAVPSLADNATNWLSVLAYDAYLFGVLAEVGTYLMDDAEMAKHYSRSQTIIDGIRDADVRVFGPLVSRKAR